jgi:hypothetical protein
MRSTWSQSPQEVDPLSWFAGPRLPLVFSVAAIAQGVVITFLYWNDWSSVALQFVAMPFFLISGWLTGMYAQPNRPRLGARQAALALLIASLGLVISAIGTVGSVTLVQQWWPGIALGVALASLAPYSSARQMVAYSIPTVIAVAVVGSLVFSSITNFWPPVGIVVIAVGPVVVAAVASVVFCFTVVERTLAFLETSAGNEEVYTAIEPLTEIEEKGSVARMSARVAPFVEKVARSGMITPSDRAFAAQIARRLRTELVTATNRSWLDVVAHETGMVVSDPGRLADRMNESQRAALRGLLLVALDSAVVDKDTLLIELRARQDGSTAVALSIDVDLPEGRRLLLIAPYYLTLKTTVDDLSWDDGRRLLLQFRIPPTR